MLVKKIKLRMYTFEQAVNHSVRKTNLTGCQLLLKQADSWAKLFGIFYTTFVLYTNFTVHLIKTNACLKYKLPSPVWVDMSLKKN